MRQVHLLVLLITLGMSGSIGCASDGAKERESARGDSIVCPGMDLCRIGWGSERDNCESDDTCDGSEDDRFVDCLVSLSCDEHELRTACDGENESALAQCDSDEAACESNCNLVDDNLLHRTCMIGCGTNAGICGIDDDIAWILCRYAARRL